MPKEKGNRRSPIAGFAQRGNTGSECPCRVWESRAELESACASERLSQAEEEIEMAGLAHVRYIVGMGVIVRYGINRGVQVIAEIQPHWSDRRMVTHPQPRRVRK